MTKDEAQNGAQRVACTESLELVRRAQAGESQALNDLLARYYPRVHRIVRLRLGRTMRGHLESVDIMQETFIAAVHGFDRFEMRSESSLLHWLARIAENQIRAAADYHAAKKRDRRREVAMRWAREALESGELTIEPAAEAVAALDGLIRSEDVEAVEAAMEELQEAHRDVILLRDYVGGTWEQVREWLDGKSVDSVRMQHARALIELSKLVRRRVSE